MMRRYRLLLALIAAFAVLAFACNGDDDDDKESPSASARTPNGGGDTATPDGGGDKSPVDQETPTESETPLNTPTQPPPATEGTPAVAPGNESIYVAQFAGRDVQEQTCAYNPATRVTECCAQSDCSTPDRVKYAVEPPLVGQDISCSRGFVDGQPEYIRCSSVDPQQNKYYEIQVE